MAPVVVLVLVVGLVLVVICLDLTFSSGTAVVVVGGVLRGVVAGARGVGSGTTTTGPGFVVTQTPFSSTAGATQSASWVTVGVGTGADVGAAGAATRPRSSGPAAA